MENFNIVPDKGTFGGSVEVINQNFLLAQQEMEYLRQLYNNLQKSQPIPVTQLPATGEAGKIYRLAGTTSYSDYMWNGTQFIKMAEYNNAIDDEPIAGSNNLVKSGGVYLKINQEKQRAETSEQNLQESVASIQKSVVSIKEETLEENREMVNSILENYAPIEIHGDVTNAPDEEDLTSVNVGGTDVLKFKDKAYNPITYSGLGRKYLRKNMVNGINTLTQSMINQANTIYVIQYDFTIGEDITIPADCVLEFKGGSINGENTLIGDYTLIKADNDGIFDESVDFDGSFTGIAYADWVKTVNDDAAIQINKLLNVFKEVHFKNKEYHIRTSVSVKYNLVGYSRGTTLIVHTPIAMEYQDDYGRISCIKFKAYDGGTLFSRCNDKNFFDCEFEDFDYISNRNVYVGRVSFNGCRFEHEKAFATERNLVNEVMFNDCFINYCDGWFTGSTVYTNVSFNNTNIQQTNLIGEATSNSTIVFTNVTFNNCYVETSTFDFGTRDSSGSIYCYACHFCLHRIIDTGQNPAQGNANDNLLITFDSCDIQIPNLSEDLPQFNINNYIMIKLIGSSSNIGTWSGSGITPISNVELLINNKDRLWHETTKALSGKWTSSIKYGDKNVDGTYVSDVSIIDDYNNGSSIFTQEKLNEMFPSSVDNKIYKIRRLITLSNLQEIHLGNNCVLIFEGGKIRSGTTGTVYLKGDNIKVVTNGEALSALIDVKVTIEGSIFNEGSIRPLNLNARDSGFVFFDSSLTPARPIWWNGTAWVDATGATV